MRLRNILSRFLDGSLTAMRHGTCFVVPSTGAVLDLPLDNAGTLLGAMCFLVGEALMLSVWRAEVRARGAHPTK